MVMIGVFATEVHAAPVESPPKHAINAALPGPPLPPKKPWLFVQ
jgi:hypothetical protein